MRAEALMKMEALMEVTTETLTLKLMNESVGFASCLASTSCTKDFFVPDLVKLALDLDDDLVTGNCKPWQHLLH